MIFTTNKSFAIVLTLFMGIFTVLNLTACGTTVERVSSDSVTDISGNWNDTDSRLVAKEMVDDLVSTTWLARFKSVNGRVPTVIIDKVRNLSHEHINTQTFIADIERSMINSGELDFVASSTERSAIRTEREDQDLNASEETRKAMGEESGADFMLQGSINSIVDAKSGEQVRFYQIDLTLIDIANNKKTWVGQKKIKKSIEKGGLRW